MEKRPPDEPGVVAGVWAALLVIAIAAASFAVTAMVAGQVNEHDLKSWSRSQLEEIGKWLED